MTDSLERRLRQLRSRVLIRAWRYRQRDHAQGVWFRLRRALVDAREAFALPVAEARALVEEGFPVEAVGQELEPARIIVRVPKARLESVAGARGVPVRLGRDLLGAEALALVPFEGADRAG
jgi:hypothetical protein